MTPPRQSDRLFATLTGYPVVKASRRIAVSGKTDIGHRLACQAEDRVRAASAVPPLTIRGSKHARQPESFSKASGLVSSLGWSSAARLQPASGLAPFVKQPLAKAPQLRALQRLGAEAHLKRMRRAPAGRNRERQRESCSIDRLAQQGNAAHGEACIGHHGIHRRRDALKANAAFRRSACQPLRRQPLRPLGCLRVIAIEIHVQERKAFETCGAAERSDAPLVLGRRHRQHMVVKQHLAATFVW